MTSVDDGQDAARCGVDGPMAIVALCERLSAALTGLGGSYSASADVAYRAERDRLLSSLRRREPDWLAQAVGYALPETLASIYAAAEDPQNGHAGVQNVLLRWGFHDLWIRIQGDILTALDGVGSAAPELLPASPVPSSQSSNRPGAAEARILESVNVNLPLVRIRQGKKGKFPTRDSLVAALEKAGERYRREGTIPEREMLASDLGLSLRQVEDRVRHFDAYAEWHRALGWENRPR